MVNILGKGIATAKLQGVLSCNLPILENISGESVSDGVLGTRSLSHLAHLLCR